MKKAGAKVSANEKRKKPAGKTAKLKLSTWYQTAARSIAVSNERSPDLRNELLE
jgi:hypothetical protein